MDDLNKQVYSTIELENWRDREDNLFDVEKYVLQKYLTDRSKNVLEAGCGGGRIIFNIEKMGFRNLQAFDYVPEMIEHARQKAETSGSRVKFLEADAVDLKTIADNEFFYTVYLQQVICFIPVQLIQKALDESYRITANGGTAIFSFLYYDGMKRNKYFSAALTLLRFLRGEKLSPRQLPWLKLNHKFNKKFLSKNQPVNYWFKKDEILGMLKKSGFTITEVKSAGEISGKNKDEGMLYVVGRK